MLTDIAVCDETYEAENTNIISYARKGTVVCCDRVGIK